MKSQKGFTSIALIIFGVLFVIGFLVFIFVVVKPFNTQTEKLNSSVSESQKVTITPKVSCESKDLGGCDTEKNFYKWKDDGLP